MSPIQKSIFSKQAGFTLIELIMVIVILGILSAFALPKFADFSSDAEVASIEGARGAVRSAAAIAHAACLASSSCDAAAASSTVTIEGASIPMVFGYPSVAGIQTAATLEGYEINTTATSAGLLVSSGNTAGTSCFTYDEAADATTPPAIGAAGTVTDTDGTFGNTDDTCN